MRVAAYTDACTLSDCHCLLLLKNKRQVNW